jgi:hypothetical protein
MVVMKIIIRDYDTLASEDLKNHDREEMVELLNRLDEFSNLASDLSLYLRQQLAKLVDQ